MADGMGKLAEIFERFPGIGPRQAGRFVQFLLRSSPALRRGLIEALQDLSQSTHQCALCKRYFSSEEARTKDSLCAICSSLTRDRSLLAVVVNDTDLAALDKSGSYRGFFFVLGNTISLASEKANLLREKDLLESIPERVKNGLKEIILAFPANPEGDFTILHLRGVLAPLAEKHSFRISTLGRGLSTGSELEYADPDTLKSAIESRR